MSHAIPAVNDCVDALRKLEGLPPYDTGSNIVRSDGYFSQSIERDYPEAVRKEAKKIIKREKFLWALHRKTFLKSIG